MKIAIIGSGVSGLVSAYLLSPYHTVTLFEKDRRIGGHSHTIHIKEHGENISVDNGFMVYNPQRYPNFVNLLKELDINSTETKMTFGVHIPGDVMYQGTFPKGLFANKNNIWNIRFLKFLLDIIQFKSLAKRHLKENNNTNETLNQFLEKNRISQDVKNWFLFPMLSAIWSIKKIDLVGEFPASSTFVFLNNHKLLDFTQPTWRTIVGGSTMYVSKIKEYIEKNGTKIYCNSNITRIVRSKNSVQITVNGKTEVFDYAIFATHADTTKNLISDISFEEKTALEKFSYSINKVVLHKDTRYAPSDRNLLAAWNFTQVNGVAIFTYCMNILQHIPFTTPVFVTLNPQNEIEKKYIYSSEEYAHPQYNLQTIEGQRLMKKMQGKNRTFHVGAHLGYGFHEDGVVSAIEVAKYFDILPPWKK